MRRQFAGLQYHLSHSVPSQNVSPGQASRSRWPRPILSVVLRISQHLRLCTTTDATATDIASIDVEAVFARI